MARENAGTRRGTRKRFDHIAEHIELLILAGRLRPGDRLKSERAYMAEFGAGRSSVREALFALQRKGMIRMVTGARAIVTEPSAEGILSELSSAAQVFVQKPRGLRELQLCRTLFEVGLVRIAAEQADDADLASIRAALDANLNAETPEDFVASDLAFHHAIAAVSDNSIFMALESALIEWLTEQRRESARAGATVDQVRERHRAIYEAIARRDAESAQQAMQRHLDEVMEAYWTGRG